VTLTKFELHIADLKVIIILIIYKIIFIISTHVLCILSKEQ
jgi:hypothetical protein